MPSSTWVPISTVLDHVWKTNPRTVLDLGIGFGRWGFLCREFCDVFKGRLKPQQWRTKITGVEAFSDYIMEHHKFIYDDIIIGEAYGTLEYYVSQDIHFDLVIAGDIIEHFPKARGKRFLELCKKVTGKKLVLGVPFGDGYKQGAAMGNPYEEHKSTWDSSDFSGANILIVRERVKKRPYGIVTYDY